MEEQAQQLGTAVSIFRLQAPAAPVQRAGGRAPATV